MNTLAGILFFWLRVLPFRISLPLSQLIILLFLLRYRREIEENYGIFNKRDRKFWIRNGLELGRNSALMLQLGKRDKGILDGIRVRGEERLREAYRKGRGVIVVSLHFGPFEVLPQLFAYKGYKVAITVDHQKSRWLEKGLVSLRSYRGVRLIDSIPQMIDVLRKGFILGFLLDNTHRVEKVFRHSLFKDFGVIKTPFILSKLTKAPIFPMIIYKNSIRPEVEIGDPLNFKDNPIPFFEPFIKRNPEEWVWFGK